MDASHRIALAALDMLIAQDDIVPSVQIITEGREYTVWLDDVNEWTCGIDTIETLHTQFEVGFNVKQLKDISKVSVWTGFAGDDYTCLFDEGTEENSEESSSVDKSDV